MAKTVRIDPDEEGSSAATIKWAQAMVGSVVAERYRVEAVITASEIGAVYRAEHLRLKTPIVLKVLDTGSAARDVGRFEREGLAGAKIKHPNVAGAIDFGDLPDGGQYLVIEHIAGATLREVMKKGAMPVRRALKIAVQIGAALAAAHAQGIVHRNVEPRNVMLTGESGDRVKLIDFGRARIDPRRVGSEHPGAGEGEDLTARTLVLTTTGIVEGTTAYLPPEAALGSAVLDERGDLYALGVVLYEMLCGVRPFREDEPAALFKAQREEEPPRLSSHSLSVPSDVQRVVDTLLSRLREDRYPSAQAAVDALDAAIAAMEAGPPSGAALTRTPTRSSLSIPPHLRLPVFGGIIAIVIGALIAIFVSSSSADKTSKSAKAREDDDESESSSTRPSKTAAATATHSAAGDFSAGAEDSAAPSASAAEEEEGTDLDKVTADLSRAVKDENWAHAAKIVTALLEQVPEAFDDAKVSSDAVATAVALESGGGDRADAIFDGLTNKLEEKGLWMLFDIVRTKGGTKGSERATKILKDPAVVKREPPPLQIAFQLVVAPCGEKAALFSRAAEQGDERSYTALKALKEMECPRNKGACCFRENKEIDDAIEKLRVKLGKPKETRR